MSRFFARATRALLCFAIASLFVACAKDDVTPVEIKDQAFADLRIAIADAIDDQARESEAIRLIGVLQQDFETLFASITERKSRVRELNADYDTSRAEFKAYLTKIEAEVRENRQRVGATHLAFLAVATAEEREAVRKSHTKAMNAAIRSLQGI